MLREKYPVPWIRRFSVEVVLGAMIQFTMQPQGVADWLQNLTKCSLTKQNFAPFQDVHSTKPDPIDQFWLQYSHARCCSLLRLGHRERLLTLEDPNPLNTPRFWSIIEPEPFPWLNALGQLRLTHPAEYQLIATLGMGLDLIPAPASITQWQKLALF
ncbi:MAG: hypothetical protein ACFBSC_06595, partial [Microcoleaceae cyanobacterium]